MNGVDGLKVNAVEEMDSMGRYDELRLILCEKRMYIVKIRV
jgi:hypothetical protein